MNRTPADVSSEAKQFQPKTQYPRFTVRRAYQKPPTARVRGVRPGNTTMTHAGIVRAINRLKGYAQAAALDGDMKQARKYQQGLNKFLRAVTSAMRANGMAVPTEQETESLLKIEGVTP